MRFSEHQGECEERSQWDSDRRPYQAGGAQAGEEERMEASAPGGAADNLCALRSNDSRTGACRVLNTRESLSVCQGSAEVLQVGVATA